MIPQKLCKGDKVCIIAPSRSMGILSNEIKDIAINNLENIGLKVVFSKNINEIDEYGSSTISSRLNDLHEAFGDKSIKGILTVIGGYNSNQLINKIDYKLLKQNPKILCGFSDITALSNAIYARTGLITYYGPHFSSFGMKKGLEYTLKYFKKCLMLNDKYTIEPTNYWSNDPWFKDQDNRNFIPNHGFDIINSGKATGPLIGGNLCTFNLLQGTKYFPKINNSILILEDDSLTGNKSLVEFDRNLQSLIECKDFSKVKGLIIGRFEIESMISREQLIKVIKNKKELEKFQ